ncbi:MAG: hypothetical protein ACXVJD_13925 [Mucilaginibacter sp.]
MPAEHYITSSCSISENSVFKNGIRLFENQGTDVSGFLLSVYQHFAFNYPKFYKMDNLSKLGWLAAELLLKDDFHQYRYQPEEIGVVLANSNSSLDNDLKYSDTLKDIPSPSVFVYTLPNIVIGEICIRNNFKGEHTFFIQERFDAGFIAQQVNYLLDHDILQACICGWVDVLERHYKATLFLIEKKKEEKSLLFSAENIERIFNKV